MKRTPNQGFTLIELMVVIAIIAGVVVIGVPRLVGRGNQYKSVFRDFITVSRDLQAQSKLQGATYRLVLDLREENSTEPQLYWVEKSTKQILLKKDDPHDTKQILDAQEEEQRKNAEGFEPATKILKKPKEIPPTLRIESVELSRLRDPIRFGKTYVHYLPQGLAEEAAIHIKSKDGKEWTINIHPLTGKAILIPDRVNLQEITKQ